MVMDSVIVALICMVIIGFVIASIGIHLAYKKPKSPHLYTNKPTFIAEKATQSFLTKKLRKLLYKGPYTSIIKN